jgi:hypothetical protein
LSGPRKEGDKDKLSESKSVQPLEEHQVTETVDTSNSYRRDKGDRKEKSREKSVRFETQLDDDYSTDEEPSPIPIIKLMDIEGTSNTDARKWTRRERRRAEEDRQERAYKLVSHFNPDTVEDMIEKASDTELEGVKSMKGILTKTRAPIRQSLVSEIDIPPSAFPFMEEVLGQERDDPPKTLVKQPEKSKGKVISEECVQDLVFTQEHCILLEEP